MPFLGKPWSVLDAENKAWAAEMKRSSEEHQMDENEKLYSVACANCGHLGEAHCCPSEGGDCPNDGNGCDCPGFQI